VRRNFADEYAKAKVETELLINLETSKGNIIGCNPRLFAFFGPLLPLDQKYAIGNFMSSAIQKKSIKLKSNGLSERSYLHAAHLASQMVFLLSNPVLGASHVGSSEAMSIISWAQYISDMFHCGPVVLGDSEETNTCYVPEPDSRIPPIDISAKDRDQLFRNWFNWLNLQK
jgi:nucleoside-diphosphate-sugar epimerase